MRRRFGDGVDGWLEQETEDTLYAMYDSLGVLSVVALFCGLVWGMTLMFDGHPLGSILVALGAIVAWFALDCAQRRIGGSISMIAYGEDSRRAMRRCLREKGNLHL